MKRTLIAIGIVAALGAAACDTEPSDTTLPGFGDTTTIPGIGDTTTTTTGDALGGTVEALQAQMTALAAEIQASEATDELQAAWDELQSDVQTAAQSLQSGSSYDTTELQNSIDQFESALADLGSDTAAELQTAWSQLRVMLDSLVS